jgi:small subunit ribosomal protein S17
MNTRRKLIGYVKSNNMERTVVVEFSRTYRHPLYKKTVHRRNKVMAHDDLGCQVGDQVRIIESRPISRLKRWVVTEIIRRNVAGAELEA